MTRLGTGKESDLKSSIAQYLQVLENQQKCWYERLNSGELLVVNKDGSKRLVKLCREGTADFILMFWHKSLQVVFIETKRKGKKQSDNQIEFEVKIKGQGAQYYVVDSLDQFFNLMEQFGIS